ncbi:MAG: F0F1 ATP synthase subunit B [Candidatus Brocadiales bacterium]
MEFLKALGVDFRLLLIQAAGFLILLYILRKYLFDTILAMIKARREEVQETYDKSEEYHKEAANLKAEYQRKVTEAEEEAEEKLTAAVKEAKALGEELVEKSRQEAEAIKLKANETLELERKKAATEIRDQVVNLSMLAAQRIVGQSVDKQKAGELVDEFITDVEGLSDR